MKSAYITDPMKFEVRETADPTCPADGLILRVKACGVCGSDLRRWKEGPGDILVIAGHEIGGIVEEVGKSFTGYAIGDHLAVAPDVHCGKCHFCRHGLFNLCDQLHLVGITPGYDGGFSEKIVLSAEILSNGIVHHIPAGATFEQAALSEPCSSVLAAHDKACTDLGHTVLVMGGGPIGCLHIAVAQARGARVFLSEPSLVRRQIATDFNPSAIIDPMTENLNERINQLTDGVGVDIVVCANPVASTQTQAVEVVRKGGRVILFGGLPKASPMASLDSNLIHYGEISIVGSFSYHPTYHKMALDIISRGSIPTDKLITHRFSINEINNAFQTASAGEALKVIVTF